MAATVEARRLTEAHRLAQLRLGRRTVALLVATWPLIRIDDIDETSQRWLAVALPIVATQRAASASLAATYLRTFRALELGVDAPDTTPVVAAQIDERALATSLIVTGPAALRAALDRKVPAARALDVAQARSAGAAMRHALNGGRATIIESVRVDSTAIGWARSTSGSACAFCAMLASRGPVYKADAADFHAHDHCSCAAVPIYRRDAAWPAGSRRFRELWNTSTADAAPGEKLAAFRRALSA